MTPNTPINLSSIFNAFRGRIVTTWLLVLLETIGMTLIPLAMGTAIDGLLSGDHAALIQFGMLLTGLTLTGVLRRVYDTRAYSSIRVQLGLVLTTQQVDANVSLKSARLNMGRELVDFLEQELPGLITALVQITITFVVLTMYDSRLSLSALAMTIGVLIIYGLFHTTLYKCNAGINNRMERQVSVLNSGKPRKLLSHLLGLKQWEIRLSDREAVMYGCIFLVITAFIIYNLMVSAGMDHATPGRLFTILSYSWEYAEAVIALPGTLLFFTRIKEITRRIAVRNEM